MDHLLDLDEIIIDNLSNLLQDPIICLILYRYSWKSLLSFGIAVHSLFWPWKMLWSIDDISNYLEHIRFDLFEADLEYYGTIFSV